MAVVLLSLVFFVAIFAACLGGAVGMYLSRVALERTGSVFAIAIVPASVILSVVVAVRLVWGLMLG